MKDKDGGLTGYATTVIVNNPPSSNPTSPPNPGGGYEGILRTLYVSATGNDSGNGSETNPWKTLQKAANNARAGDMIVVRAGTYAGFQIETDGTAANPIVFKADPNVLVNAKHSSVSAFSGAINL
ncbi:MAG: DUF1565 domain-containing protein, partial [Planctomycetia bacterium]|nr:DUF1565 domain-containing protein [Planctomycetia bacterium]